ncbi:hypothetical protein H4R18_004661 [Coemansia javaensis]|uniref:Uncharacterized protein n=1 Tax=Coemansia javaensis TaxID=2761396 RepID=A0A9W8HA45_9FUNG|nr:hypothetical protein H4R18_004661 [Coemansia javaensis]
MVATIRRRREQHVELENRLKADAREIRQLEAALADKESELEAAAREVKEDGNGLAALDEAGEVLLRAEQRKREAEAEAEAEAARQAALAREAEAARQAALAREAEAARQAALAREAEAARQAALAHEAEVPLSAASTAVGGGSGGGGSSSSSKATPSPDVQQSIARQISAIGSMMPPRSLSAEHRITTMSSGGGSGSGGSSGYAGRPHYPTQNEAREANRRVPFPKWDKGRSDSLLMTVTGLGGAGHTIKRLKIAMSSLLHYSVMLKRVVRTADTGQVLVLRAHWGFVYEAVHRRGWSVLPDIAPWDPVPRENLSPADTRTLVRQTWNPDDPNDKIEVRRFARWVRDHMPVVLSIREGHRPFPPRRLDGEGGEGDSHYTHVYHHHHPRSAGKRSPRSVDDHDRKRPARHWSPGRSPSPSPGRPSQLRITGQASGWLESA